jgi:putative DNA primase/helicase
MSLTDKIDSEFRNQFVSFSYLKLEIIRENIKNLSQIICKSYSNRFADQFGSLIAAFLSIKHNKILTNDELIEYLTSYDLKSFYAFSNSDQGFDLLSDILQIRIRIPGDHFEEASLGECIKKVHFNTLSRIKTDPDVINETLRSYGIKIKDDYLYIANSTQLLRKNLKGSSVPSNWGTVLKRLPGASGSNTEYFGPNFPAPQGKSRCTKIDIHLVINYEGEADSVEI